VSHTRQTKNLKQCVPLSLCLLTCRNCCQTCSLSFGVSFGMTRHSKALSIPQFARPPVSDRARTLASAHRQLRKTSAQRNPSSSSSPLDSLRLARKSIWPGRQTLDAAAWNAAKHACCRRLLCVVMSEAGELLHRRTYWVWSLIRNRTPSFPSCTSALPAHVSSDPGCGGGRCTSRAGEIDAAVLLTDNERCYLRRAVLSILSSD